MKLVTINHWQSQVKVVTLRSVQVVDSKVKVTVQTTDMCLL